jgi:two-component system NtrC family response regulator
VWRGVVEGRFRVDLYYRLNVISIEMPPLRERREDVPMLAAHFLGKYTEENQRDVAGFSPQAMDALTEYSWPGNVRELENAVERAVVLCRGATVDVDELPQAVRGGGDRPFVVDEIPDGGIDFREAVASYQAHLIREALHLANGVQRRAARILRLSPTTLNEMVHRLGVAADED